MRSRRGSKPDAVDAGASQYPASAVSMAADHGDAWNQSGLARLPFTDVATDAPPISTAASTISHD